jgi:thioredoxin reductase (NADPH)
MSAPPSAPSSGLVPAQDLFSSASAAVADVVVLSFCAQWCGTCREFRPVLEAISAAHPEIAFGWLDIEDDAEFADEVDVEDFPTLAIIRGGVPLYFGATLPLDGVVRSLLRAAVASTQPQVAAPDGLARLAARLHPQR